MLVVNGKFEQTNFNTMAKLLVKDPKTGEPREMTERSFQLAGSKRGFTVIGKVEEPKSEIQKLMDQKIAERAEKEAAKEPTKEEPKDEHKTEVKEKAKPGPKPKTV